MASGDSLLGAYEVTLPATAFAQITDGPGLATPAETWRIAKFTDAVVENLDFIGRLAPIYGGGNIKVSFYWYAASATANNCRWEAGFRRVQPGTTDWETGTFTFAFQSATATASSAVGILVKTEITFTPAQAGNIAAGEPVVLRLRRNGPDAADTMTGGACVPIAMLALFEA